VLRCCERAELALHLEFDQNLDFPTLLRCCEFLGVEASANGEREMIKWNCIKVIRVELPQVLFCWAGPCYS